MKKKKLNDMLKTKEMLVNRIDLEKQAEGKNMKKRKKKLNAIQEKVKESEELLKEMKIKILKATEQLKLMNTGLEIMIASLIKQKTCSRISKVN
ncbi:MAG: hypothetical protein R2771_12550 [Saprospiraceae bacterium]